MEPPHPTDVMPLCVHRRHRLLRCVFQFSLKSAGAHAALCFSIQFENLAQKVTATLDGADGTPPSKVAVQDHSRLCSCAIKSKEQKILWDFLTT